MKTVSESSSTEPKRWLPTSDFTALYGRNRSRRVVERFWASIFPIQLHEGMAASRLTAGGVATMDWSAMTLDARNLAYNNVEHVGPAFARDKTESWLQKSQGVRARESGHLDLPYADAERTKWDLYPSENPNAPCLVHVHGGYWQRGSKEIFACLTDGVRAHGWSAALPGYSLAPDASLSQIVSELRLALDWFVVNAPRHGVEGPVILTGWSAGGHLTALLLDHRAVKAGFCISGVFDLARIMHSGQAGVA